MENNISLNRNKTLLQKLLIIDGQAGSGKKIISRILLLVLIKDMSRRKF
jgi:hypothetical protein